MRSGDQRAIAPPAPPQPHSVSPSKSLDSDHKICSIWGTLSLVDPQGMSLTVPLCLQGQGPPSHPEKSIELFPWPSKWLSLENPQLWKQKNTESALKTALARPHLRASRGYGKGTSAPVESVPLVSHRSASCVNATCAGIKALCATRRLSTNPHMEFDQTGLISAEL